MDLANINPIKDLFSPFFDPLSDFFGDFGYCVHKFNLQLPVLPTYTQIYR